MRNFLDGRRFRSVSRKLWDSPKDLGRFQRSSQAPTRFKLSTRSSDMRSGGTLDKAPRSSALGQNNQMGEHVMVLTFCAVRTPGVTVLGGFHPDEMWPGNLTLHLKCAPLIGISMSAASYLSSGCAGSNQNRRMWWVFESIRFSSALLE